MPRAQKAMASASCRRRRISSLATALPGSLAKRCVSWLSIMLTSVRARRAAPSIVCSVPSTSATASSDCSWPTAFTSAVRSGKLNVESKPASRYVFSAATSSSNTSATVKSGRTARTAGIHESWK
jgi:hypothetical protein